MTPHFASAIEKIASSLAITMSAAAAIPVPPPKHPPCIIAIVGLGNSIKPLIALAVLLETSMFSS